MKKKTKEKKEIAPKKNGRPCGYCSDPTIQTQTDKYIQDCNSPTKPKIPYVQELAMILDTWAEVLEDWTDKIDEKGELEHPLFNQSIKRLKNIQQFRLLQRTLGRFNPTGAIFQLKVNHKYIETEKKLLVGDSENPFKYDITLVEAKITDD